MARDFRFVTVGSQPTVRPDELLWSSGNGIGDVFVVYNAADVDVGAWLAARVPSSNLFPATSLTADIAIQAALDACVANRNDYVVVMPSGTNYSITQLLAMSKKAVHLICPAGLQGADFPVGNTARLKAITAGQNIIAMSAEACEVAGFYLKNYTALAAITLAAGVSAQNIHHNAFMMVWSGSPVAQIVGVGAGGAWGSIMKNWFISETGTGITAAIAAIDIAAQATGCRVCHNEVTIGDANIATIGISNQAIKGHTDFNIFSESGGSGVQSGGTITNCVNIAAAGCAIGNRCAVAAGGFAAGGTAAHSFTDNMDGATGAGNGAAGNLEA